MAVAPADSSPKPKNKRKRPLKKEEEQIVCFNPKKSESKKKRINAEAISRNNSSSAMERAKEVQANLAPEFPSLVKYMLHSHVTGGFWLGLPKKFCDLHLPKHDEMIVLEDEIGQVCETKYLAAKVGLSAGWRGFSIAHKLVEGDVAVFHLVSPTKFKVYIVRSKGSDEVDCALGLLKLEARITKAETGDIIAFERETESLEPLLEGSPDENIQKNSSEISVQSDKDSENVRPEVLDGIRLSDSVIPFEEVRSIDDFNILVNGLIINSELSKHLQGKYYLLCCSQKAFLHKQLIDGLNCKLVAGIISETINIADAIRAGKITTTVDDFATWDQTLKAFEVLGMKVGFLRDRLNGLISLALESKRYENVRVARNNAKEELRVLEAKVLEAKEKMARLNTVFEALGVNCQDLEIMFRKIATAPWC